MSTPGSDSSDDYILQLPPETLLHIASYIDKPHDLIALAHTDATLRSYAVAKLYSRICLYRWSAKTIEVLDHLAKFPILASRVDNQIPWPSGKCPNLRIPRLAPSR